MVAPNNTAGQSVKIKNGAQLHIERTMPMVHFPNKEIALFATTRVNGRRSAHAAKRILKGFMYLPHIKPSR